MKNGLEIRKNGNLIITRQMELLGLFKMYYVYLKHEKGGFIESRNGPWDYLDNARRDADNEL